MRHWSARVAVCALALPLLLTGCAQKHQASESLPTTSATTAAKTLPPLGPADFPVPAEARQRDVDGVVAFSRYYVELSNHLLKTFESQPLRELSAKCKACIDLADGYDRARAAGYRCEGGELTITSTGTAVVKDNQAEISLLIKQAAITVWDGEGSVVQSQSSGAFSLGGGMTLSWDDSRHTWIVIQWTTDRL